MTNSDGVTPKAAAFFDVDNTLIRGASLYHVARGLARRDLITGRQIVHYAWKQLKYLTSGKEHVKDLKFVTDATMEFVAGRDAALVLDVCRDVVDDILMHKLWPSTLRLAEAHLRAGQEVWLVTAAPNELAILLAERIGLTGGMGTRAEIVDGVYTGHIEGAPLHGQAKADAVKQIASERGIDLDASTAYSDSSNDLPMLNVVGYAVPVNPDAALRRIARRNGWMFVECRRSRFWRDNSVPSNPNAAVGAGIAAGLAASALDKTRRN
jgi:HAD superfamily hydrolase (TIGR01490 family)